MIKSDLHSHVTTRHASPELEPPSDGSQCEECGVVLQNAEDLKKHLELEHDLNECSLEDREENSEQPDLKVKILKLEKELSDKNILLQILEEVCEEGKKNLKDIKMYLKVHKVGKNCACKNGPILFANL